MEHVYVSSRASGFKVTVVVTDDKDKDVRHTVSFEKGQFKTDDDKVAAELDKLIQNGKIRKFVRKTDKAAAETLARKHAEVTKYTGAMKGGVTAGAAKAAMDTTLQQRDAELRSHRVDTDALARDESLLVTEQAPEPIAYVPNPEVGKNAEVPFTKPKLSLGGDK